MKTSIRSCTGCRRSGEKSGFVRVVRSPVGLVGLDPTGRAPGRGAYVCRSEECLKKALKGSRLSRALRVSVPDVLLEELRQAVQASGGG